MQWFCQRIGLAFHAGPSWFPAILSLLIAASQAVAQPVHRPSQAETRPRLGEVRATQRYRTMSGISERSGGLAWYESTVGISSGLFLPGPGLVRVGTGYTHARFAFHPDTRLGAAGSEPFRDVRELRLSAQLLTPWSETWSSLALGAVASAFEAGAEPHDSLSGVAVLGAMRRLSARLSAGVGVLLLHPLGKQAATVLPFFLVDWQVTDRLALRSRQDIRLTYLLDPRRRLSVAAVGSFFGRRDFRLDERGNVPSGVAEIKGFEVGGRVVWEPFPPLVVEGAVEAALRQTLRLEDRAGREVVAVGLEDALRLSLLVRYRF